MKIQRCSCLVITGGEVVRSAMCPIHPPVLLPVSEAPQDEETTLHDAAMALAYDDADEWAVGYFTSGYKANLLAQRIEELVEARLQLALPRTPERPRGEPPGLSLNIAKYAMLRPAGVTAPVEAINTDVRERVVIDAEIHLWVRWSDVRAAFERPRPEPETTP